MENNEITKTNKIKVIVITLLIFIVSIAGISYAYFTIQITGNDTASSMRLSTANMSLIYNDVQIASGEYVTPGWSETKTLTVTNNGNVTSDYIIKFRELTNTIIYGELVLLATCSSSSGTCDNLPERAVHSASTEITNAYMYGPISIDPGVTHTYTLTIEFIETGSNQNYNQNKYFNGTLNIGDGTATPESCFTISNFTSSIVQIANYDETCGSDVIIPSVINGKTISRIYGSGSNGAFNNKGLTSVIIPNSVTTIGSSAFSSNQLTSVVIPNSVITLRGFSNNQLVSAVIPNSVTTLGGFSSNQLTSVAIPSSVTTIEGNAFDHNQLTLVIIPSSVTTIESSAFYNNQLVSITIPNSVTTIGNQAFLSNQLTSVTIEGKSSSGDFTSYGSNIWGWATGYSDSNIVWTGSGS